MKIIVNETEREVADGAVVADLIDRETFTGNVAVALNNAIVRRDAWSSTGLKEGDDVVIITAAYGG